MKIGEAGKATGVNVQTVRCFEWRELPEGGAAAPETGCCECVPMAEDRTGSSSGRTRSIGQGRND